MVNVEMDKITLGKTAGGNDVTHLHDANFVVRTGNAYRGVLYMDIGAYVCDVEYMCTKCGEVWTRKEKVS